MRSMTGFGSSDFVYEGRTYSIDLKAYNNRYLEISVNVHPALTRLEKELRLWLQERIRRGSVELKVWPKSKAQSALYHVDEASAKAAAIALRSIAKIAGLRVKPSLTDILSFEGVLNKDTEIDLESFKPFLIDALERCFESFNAMRATEGEKTALDIVKQLERLKVAHTYVASKAIEMDDAVKKAVLDRFRAVLGDEIDEKRTLAEAAALLVKSSVNEECARLAAHLESIENEMLKERRMGEGIGKKLDFICQEINREVNTIGSKSLSIDIDRCVVEMKDAVENIREQLRNLE